MDFKALSWLQLIEFIVQLTTIASIAPAQTRQEKNEQPQDSR
jgi:hypothetical protein